MGNVEKIVYMNEDNIDIPINCFITDLNYIIYSYIINTNSQNNYKGIVTDKDLNLIFDITISTKINSDLSSL